MSRLAGHRPEAVIRAFEHFGWEVRRKAGSHTIMKKEGNPNIVSIPCHKGRDLKVGLLRTLLRDAGIDADEFLQAI